MSITKFLCACCLVLFVSVFTILANDQPVGSGTSENIQIKNPFYNTPQWKLWRTDRRPVKIGTITLSPPLESSRVFPIDLDSKSSEEEFLAFRGSDFPGRIYAGMWDDVYASFDNRHSYIPDVWRDELGNEIPLRKQHMRMVYRFPRDPRLFRALGLTFTSQSTDGMGRNQTDSFDDIDNLERNFCFANILRAGPAHASYLDQLQSHTQDRYDAIMPCFFNSVGSSSSEVNALAKMLIVGAHFPHETKLLLKQHGLYIPTLLYLWKAALPYDVPYTNELRHRVAYASSGNTSGLFLQVRAPLNQTYHRYNETAHLSAMTSMAKGMDIAPPIALLTKQEIHGGLEKSVNKTTLRVHQRRGKSVRMRISAADSFDLQGLPLTYHWTVLHENTSVTIEALDGGREAIISVPYDRKLPKGRTVVLLTVNNGRYESNPATINIYRPYGADNLRPSLTGLADRTVLAGDEVKFDIISHDPEGFTPILYRWSNEVGTLEAGRYTWKTPNVSSVIEEQVHLIAADGTGGYNSDQATLTVTPTLAVIEADRLEGSAPLTVQFSAGQSRDKAGNVLTYAWNFDDGHTATGVDVAHTFTSPGFYEVSLQAGGPLGPHETRRIVHVRHAWAKALDNGWRRGALDRKVWKPFGPEANLVVRQIDGVSSFRASNKKETANELIGIESVRNFDVPLYLEATFTRVYSKAGTGLEVLGSLIGKLGAGIFSGDMSIGHQLTDGKWDGHYISRHLRADPISIQLQLFVDRDPNHPGRIRYTGYLESKLGHSFFRLDNQPKRGSHLRIQRRGNGGWIGAQAFQVWAPE